MKNFRVCNMDLNNWIEKDIVDAKGVVDFLKKNNYFDYSFEIEWKSPMTGEYSPIVNCEDGLISFNRYLKMPYAFIEPLR